MAQYVQITTGNTSTAANLGRVTSVATAHASNTTSDITSTPLYTDTFTAPSLVDSAVGVVIFITSNSQADGAVYRATLQEDAGAGFVDTACTADVTFTGDILGVTDFLFFRAASPYTFTTTTANKYKWKIVRTSGSGGLFRVRSSTTSSSTIWGAFVDSRNTTLSTSDDLIVPNGITATFTDGMSFGTGTYVQAFSASSFTSNALNIYTGGAVTWDTSASTTVTIKGGIAYDYLSTFSIGSEGTPYPSSYVAKLILNTNSLSGAYGLWGRGRLILNGANPTAYAVNYVSGSGTTVDPLIVSGDLGAVGDEILISGTGNYNQSEYKFIKTKNSSTSYVLSSTSGGAESGLSNTHTTRAKVCNLQRNIIIEPYSSTYPSFILHPGTSATGGYFYGKNFRANSLGDSGVGKYGIVLGYSTGQATMVIKEMSGIVCNAYAYTGIWLQSARTDYYTYSDNIFCRSASSQPGLNTSNANNKVLNRWYFIDNAGVAWGLLSTNNITMNDSIFHCNNTANGTNSGHIYISASAAVMQFNNCDFQWARKQALMNLAVAANKWEFNSCRFGDVGTNVIDFNMSNGSLNDVVFNNCICSSGTLVSNYTNMIQGSVIGFHRFGNVDRTHLAYKPEGIISSTGSGLTDTVSDTTFDSDSLACRFAPIAASSYLTVNMAIPQRAGNTITFTGRLYKTAAFNGTATVNLYLDGSTTPDDSYVLSGADSTWIPFTLTADYTAGTVDRNSKIEIKVNGSAGYVYLDTLYNAIKTSNPIGSLDLWQDGLPNRYIVSTIASGSEIAQAVWDYLADNANTVGSMGELAKENAENAELAAVK